MACNWFLPRNKFLRASSGADSSGQMSSSLSSIVLNCVTALRKLSNDSPYSNQNRSLVMVDQRSVHLADGEVTFSIEAASGSMAKMTYGAGGDEVGNGGGAV
jgi:hypothetical protein